MSPVRAFFASMSVSLMVLTLSYQATALSAVLAPPPPKPASDAWISHPAVPAKGSNQADLADLAPLVSEAI